METVAGEKPLACATSRIVTILLFRSLRRHLKRKLFPEPARLPYTERNPGKHPDRTQNLRLYAQVPPQGSADEETQHRNNEIHHRLLWGPDKIAHERGGVHPHKSDQRAKVQQLDSAPVGQEERSNKNNHANEEHIVPGNMVFFVDSSKKRFRERVASSHAVKQPRGPDLRAHP